MSNAIFNVGSKIYFFTRREYIRFSDSGNGQGSQDNGYPKTIDLWNLPSTFDKRGIDSAFQSGNKAYFFSDNEYIRLHRNSNGSFVVDAGYPKPLAIWDFPEEFGKHGINASFQSGNKAYFFSGDQYIRVTRGNTGPGTVDAGYPKSIAIWDFPEEFGKHGINAAFQSGNKAYFFSGNQYICITRGNTGPGTVDAGYPRQISNWAWPTNFSESWLKDAANISLNETARIQNWYENLKFQTGHFAKPGSYKEISDLIVSAENSNKQLRVVGSLWSYTDILYSEDIVVSLEKLNNPLGFYQGKKFWNDTNTVLNSRLYNNSNRKFALCQAGMRIRDLIQFLDNNEEYIEPSDRGRWALPTMGASSGQTIGGLLSTGSHGPDHNKPPFADYIRGIYLISNGGESYWIENTEKYINRDLIGYHFPELKKNNIIINNDWFYSVLVSAGTLGVIAVVLLEVETQYSLARKMQKSSWDALRPKLTNESLLDPINNATELLSITGHPLEIPNIGYTIPRLEAFELLINVYRKSNDYGSTANKDRDSFLVNYIRPSSDKSYSGYARRQPPPDNTERDWFVAISSVFTGGLSGIGHGILLHREMLRDAWMIIKAEGGSLKALANEISGRLIPNSRSNDEAAEYLPSFVARNTYSGTDEEGKVPGIGMEAVITTENNRHLDFLDVVFSEFDELFGQGKKFFGFFSLRFTKPSKAFLAPNFSGDNLGTTEHVTKEYNYRMCHIECLTLKEITAVDHRTNDGNMEGDTDIFVTKFERLAKQYGRLHWGQAHKLNAFDVKHHYHTSLSKYRGVKTQLEKNGNKRTFSNYFTLRTGLESFSESIACLKLNEVKLVGYSNRDNLFLTEEKNDWKKINYPIESLPNYKIISELKAVSYGGIKSTIFAFDKYHILHSCEISLDGKAKWSDYGNNLFSLGDIRGTFHLEAIQISAHEILLINASADKKLNFCKINPQNQKVLAKWSANVEEEAQPIGQVIGYKGIASNNLVLHWLDPENQLRQFVFDQDEINFQNITASQILPEIKSGSAFNITHITNVWIPSRLYVFGLLENGALLMYQWENGTWKLSLIELTEDTNSEPVVMIENVSGNYMFFGKNWIKEQYQTPINTIKNRFIGPIYAVEDKSHIKIYGHTLNDDLYILESTYIYDNPVKWYFKKVPLS
jgi:hypothetical protein